MADENIIITNLQNSDNSKKHYSSLDGMRYINTNIGAGAGGVDIALGAQGLLIQTGTNAPATQDNTIIFNNNFTNSIGDPNNPTTSYTSSLQTIAKLDSLIPAVQIAPSSNTLKIIDTFIVSNGASNETNITPSQLNLTDGASNIATLSNNFIDFLYAGGDTELYMTNDPSNFKIELLDSLNSKTSRITPSSFILSDGVINPSLSYSNNDLVLDADSGRLLLNAGDNEFYLGQYSSSSAPCIISGGNAGMYLNLNSRSGTTTIGDCDNAFNSTKISVVDTTSTITLDSGAGITQLGDINNVSNGMKIVINDSTGSINIDNNGDNVINIGDINGAGNGTKLIVNDANTTFTIAFPTIDFSGTNTTTTSGAHNADIHSTSSGVSTNKFLQCKLNGNDIWIPYFTTDPSL